MNFKKIKYLLFVCGVYAALSVALMVSLTTAKYADSKVAYAGFGAADFNVMILRPQRSESGGTQDGQVETATQLIPVRLSDNRFVPGAGTQPEEGEEPEPECGFEFAVSNGSSQADRSDVGFKYVIRLRTAKSLPLGYRLVGVGMGEGGGDVIYSCAEKAISGVTSQDDTLQENQGQEQDPDQEQTPAAPVYREDTHYEYTFEAEGKPGQEIEFLMEQRTGEPISQNFKILVEWPSEEYDRAYMKEVEIVELVVIATSLNYLDKDKYPDYEQIPEDVEKQFSQQYSTGIILLTPPDVGDSNSYRYTIDLRSFKPVVDNRQFEFIVDNAIAYGQTQRHSQISYDMKLKVPLDLVESSADGGLGYRLTMYQQSAPAPETPENLMSAAPIYRVYDEKYYPGSTVHTAEYAENMDFGTESEAKDYLAKMPEEERSHHRVYCIYSIPTQALDIERRNSSNRLEIVSDRKTYALKLMDGDMTTAAVEKIALDHRMELLVEAAFTGNAGAAQGPDTPGNGGQEGGSGGETGQ